MDFLFSPEVWISLLTLTFLEVVLGIDNIIFISIIADRLPKEIQSKARTVGLILAIFVRVLLLMGLSYLSHLTKSLFSVFEFEVTIRDLILIVGGLFLLAKSTSELHAKVKGLEHDEEKKSGVKLTFSNAIFQIIILDVVFSFDSILTAVGLSNQIGIMVAAVIISLFVMLVFSAHISNFINSFPTVKILALSFLLMIGTLLILDGFHIDVPKGYIYFSLAFSLFVEFINLRVRKKE
jgi:predicted tellurium resistance membrane protein TerC